MAGHNHERYSDYKMLKISLLVMYLFFGACNAQTNFCLNLGGVEDNLSCTGVTEGTGICFSSNSLCDGVQDCFSGIDESMTNLVCSKYLLASHLQLT